MELALRGPPRRFLDGTWARLGTRSLAVASLGLAIAVLAGGGPDQGARPSAAAPHGSPVLPAAVQATISRTLGADAREFWAFRGAGGGLVARARTQGLHASFGPDGVFVRAGAQRLGLTLHAIGRPGRSFPISRSAPRAERNRVTYRRGSVTEWYVSGPSGIEQGFDLARRPAGAAGGPVQLELSVSGGLRGRVLPGARGIAFVAHGGATPLLYRGLAVRDARGRSLPAWLSLSGDRLTISLDDRGAAYPLRVDPIVQIAKLTPSDGSTSDYPGHSLAVSADGSTIVVGDSQNGAVYVFVKPAGSFADASETAKLTPSGAGSGAGGSVAVSSDGSTIAAGATAYHGLIDNEGAVFVFTRPGGGWVSGHQAGVLVASTTSAVGNSFLGSAVSISSDGNTIAGGASGHSEVYVFTKPGGGWADGQAAAKLTASGGAGLGGSVGISGDGATVVSGAQFQTVGGHSNAGAAYVWVKPVGAWATTATPTAELDPAIPFDDEGFGNGGVAASSDGGLIVVGESFRSSNQGSAWVFVRPGGGWANATTSKQLTDSSPHNGDYLGSAVVISGDGSTILAGMPGHTVATASGQGAVDVFKKPGGGWASGNETAKLTATDGVASDGLGTRVATTSDGALLVAGDGFGLNKAYAFANNASIHSTTTSVSCSPTIGIVDFSSSVCTATVTDSAGSPTVPTGTVALGRSGLGSGSFSPATSCTLSAISSSASACSVNYAPTGGGNSVPRFDTIGGNYGGDVGHVSSSGNDGTVDVEPGFRFSHASISCTSPAQVGGGALCTVTVSDAGGGSPASAPLGNFSFFTFDGGAFSSSSCQLRAGPALSSTCSVIYSPGGPAPSTAEIKGTYSGFGSHGSFNTGFGDSGFVSETAASARSTSTTISCPGATVSPGTAVTPCTATVTDTGGGTPSAPTGDVVLSSDHEGAFSNSGSCTLGSPTSTSASCSLTYTPGISAAGDARTDHITAAYGGSGTHAGSADAADAAVPVSAVFLHPTSIALSCSGGPGAPESPTSCTATVTSTDSGPAPTGTVNLWTPGQGSFSPSPCTLGSPTAHAATCPFTYTPHGTGTTSRVDTLSGTYGGDLTNRASTTYDARNGLVAVAGPADGLRTTSTAVSCSPDPVSSGSSTSCTITVTDTASGTKTTPIGTAYLDTDSASGTFNPSSGSCALAAAAAPESASCAVSYISSFARTDTIQGTYIGNGNHVGSSSSGPTSQSLTVTAAGGTALLTVALAGTGTGAVAGPGISCPTTCSHSFLTGASGTYTATPAAGSTFSGWSGACSGTGQCAVTMDASKTVTATFAKTGGGGGGGGGGGALKPSCTLSSGGSRVFGRLLTSAAKKKKKKAKKPAAGVLKPTVSCDQAAQVTLGGTVKAVAKKKKGKKAPLPQTFPIASVAGSDAAGKPLTLTVKLSKGALSALKKGARESVALTVTATNANGSSTAAAQIAKLTLVKIKKH